jgi:DNA (cytosine-5)-methyltransferase 1
MGVPRYSSVEVCAGAGGQALGLSQAGFGHLACVEIDAAACQTLRHNKPKWTVIEQDVRTWNPDESLAGAALLAGGVPCPPFSIAGAQLGRDDERDLFPEMIRLAESIGPRTIMIENVRGILGRKFEDYRADILAEFKELGYESCGWELLDAANFGVPQTRPRAILVLAKPEVALHFRWPTRKTRRKTVGEVLQSEMEKNGWMGALAWAERACDIAPALVGGSKKHGGADLGPTRAKAAWRDLGVDGLGVADAPPGSDHLGFPRLTVQMAALIQGFPPHWRFVGRKTAAYRQVGNAFPPPVARAVGRSIIKALESADDTGSIGTKSSTR